MEIGGVFKIEFDVTEKFVEPGRAVTSWLDGKTPNVGVAPACVTVTTWFGRPVTDTVICAIRWLREKFSR